MELVDDQPGMAQQAIGSPWRRGERVDRHLFHPGQPLLTLGSQRLEERRARALHRGDHGAVVQVHQVRHEPSTPPRHTVSSTPSRRTDRNRSGTVACSTTARIAARHPSPTSSAASATARPRVTASATCPGSDARPAAGADLVMLLGPAPPRTSARGTPIVASSTAPSPAAPPRWQPHHRPLLDLADHAAPGQPGPDGSSRPAPPARLPADRRQHPAPRSHPCRTAPA